MISLNQNHAAVVVKSEGGKAEKRDYYEIILNPTTS